LEQFSEIEREKNVMRVAQPYFMKDGTRVVSLGHEQDECVCLERDGVLLAVYFSEKGGRNLIALFDSIYDALCFLSAKYLKTPQLPIDWPAINAEFDKVQEEAQR
jgi:hypothetical protein